MRQRLWTLLSRRCSHQRCNVCAQHLRHMLQRLLALLRLARCVPRCESMAGCHLQGLLHGICQ
jgi:hypothetical protein